MTAKADAPAPWRLYVGVLTPSILAAGIVGALAITNVKVLSGVRAYVAGESQWSKARADAVQHLQDFATSRDPEDFALFDMALAVPEGDRRAREELLRLEPDLAVAREGFLAGGNHPDDIDNMVTLLRQFRDQALFRDALDAWTRGDELIVELQALGERLHKEIRAGAAESQIKATVHEIREINAALVDTEKRFGASLGEASRFTENLLVGSVVLTGLLLSAGSLALIRRTLKRQAAHEQALAQANDRWSLAGSAAELGLFELEPDKDLIRLDSRAGALLGLGEAPQVLPRATLRSLIDPGDREQVQREVDEAIRRGSAFKMSYRVTPTPGDTRKIQVTGRIDTSGEGAPRRMVGVVRDVTDEDVQNQLAVQRDAAERIAQAQRFFLSRLSHELRTPLNAILGFAQLLTLDQRHPLSPAQREQVQHILTGGQQLLALVEDVLDLSKVEAGEIGMAIQEVALAPLVRTSIKLVDGVRQRFQVSIDDEVSSLGLWVRADPQRLQQVFINLLSNGAKYNRPGGHVRVTGGLEGSHVRIEVEDNGIGMTPEDAAQLFQPFKRAAGPAARIEGTGLGLYIVKQLVERMEGQVTVSSELDKGTRFTLTLPAAAAVEQPSHKL